MLIKPNEQNFMKTNMKKKLSNRQISDSVFFLPYTNKPGMGWALSTTTTTHQLHLINFFPMKFFFSSLLFNYRFLRRCFFKHFFFFENRAGIKDFFFLKMNSSSSSGLLPTEKFVSSSKAFISLVIFVLLLCLSAFCLKEFFRLPFSAFYQKIRSQYNSCCC